MCLETNNNVRFKPSDRLRQCLHYDRWRFLADNDVLITRFLADNDALITRFLADNDVLITRFLADNDVLITRFLADNDSQDYGIDNAELGEYDDEDEDEEEEDEDEADEEEVEEEGVDENGEPIKTAIKKKKKKMGGLQDALEQRSRREQMSKTRKEELGRFRQMLCAVSDV
ncbi:hypothetical protein FHG87_022639 [Trinorchestia longiramus]|nr:hypothetical protein FHG87_022639 [Trinorchestia longiramus]